MLFYVFAVALIVLVLAILLPPLLKKRQMSGEDELHHREANLAVLKGQLDELERERREGMLGEADFEQAKVEIQRRVLEESVSGNVSAVRGQEFPGRWAAISLLILLPMLSATGYWLLGTPKALDPVASMRASDITPEQIDQMVGKLAARLQANPDDTQGWIMLAKSYKALGRAKEAVEAFSKIEPAVASSPDLLVDYADTLAMLSGGDLSGKPIALVKQALMIDPSHLYALWLAGTDAFNGKQYKLAAGYWERALNVLPPEAEERQSLQDGLAEAKRRAGAAKDGRHSVAGVVDLAAKLKTQVAVGDTLFVFARAVDGPRFPLAVIKANASELPYSFVLDDSLAMMADKQISAQSNVVVEARVSHSGNAVAQNGDLQSKPLTVRVGEKGVKLLIDQVVQR